MWIGPRPDIQQRSVRLLIMEKLLSQKLLKTENRDAVPALPMIHFALLSRLAREWAHSGISTAVVNLTGIHIDDDPSFDGLKPLVTNALVTLKG